MARGAIRTWALPLVGLSFFWGYFRFQSFVGALFPLDPAGGTSPFSPYGFYLLSLVVCSAVALAIERALSSRPAGRRVETVAVGVATLVGTVATSLCLLAQAGTLPEWAAWVSAPFVAACFCLQYLGWASHCSWSFSSRTLPVMAGSYMLSLVAVVGVARLFAGWNDAVVALTPLVSGVCLLPLLMGEGISELPGKPGLSGVSGVSGVSDLPGAPERPSRKLPPSVAMFVAFLLCGAVIRGIVDIGDPGAQGVRWPLSVVMSVAMFGYCMVLLRRARVRGAGVGAVTERFVFATWLVMAALFSTGVVWGVAVGGSGTAGHLVVVARSILDFVLMVFMCDAAERWRGRASSLFLGLGMGTEVVSWALSYIAVPWLLSLGGAAGASIQTEVELGALLVLLLSMVAALGAFGMLDNRRKAADEGRAPTGQGQGDLPGGAPGDGLGDTVGGSQARPGQALEGVRAFELLAADYRLTPRESEVTELFSQGYSVKSIAESLCISLGTVQSHLKSAYRKLEIHSRDELIRLVREREAR